MAGISSIGIGSGLDIKSIINGMLELESKRLEPLKEKGKYLDNQISTVGKIKSLIAEMQDKLKYLTEVKTWNKSIIATSSNNEILTATTNNKIVSGDYQINVKQLAKYTSLNTKNFNKDNLFNEGFLNIKIGENNHKINIKDNSNLNEISKAINDANLPVSAIIINDINGQKLIINSKETGKNNNFEITTSNSLKDLILDSNKIIGKDSILTINGIEVKSNKNTFKDIIPGVELVVTKTGEVTLQFKPDVDQLTKNIRHFIKFYNEVNNLLKESTKIDEKTAGVFQADNLIINLKNKLRNIMSSEFNNKNLEFKSFSDLGIKFDKNGELKIDVSKLDKILKNNLEDINSFFTKDFGLNLKEKLNLNSILDNKNESLKNKSKYNLDEQYKLIDKVKLTETRLKKQFIALDSKMASMQALSTYITQQFSAKGI